MIGNGRSAVHGSRMSRLALPVAGLAAAGTAWLSQGTIALATPDGPRLALLPISVWALLIAFAAGVASVLLSRAGASQAPLWLLGLIVLPWLPVPVPDAFLLWAGSIHWLVWMTVGCLMVVTSRAGVWLATTARSVVGDRPRLCAGLLAFVIFAGAAWYVSPSIPGGDEPHYLVITQSLLLDHDLRIENNHLRGDYRAYFGGPLAPHYIRRGRDGEIYSIHAPGISVLVAPAFAIGGYRGVVLFLLVASAFGSALTWHLAWLATGRSSSAWFGWAAVTLSATTIFHTFTVYPDGVGGLLVLTGVWALFRARPPALARLPPNPTRNPPADARPDGDADDPLWPWLLHGAALACLPWLHSRFALLAASLGALILLRLAHTRHPLGKAVAFLIVPAIGAIAWIGFFIVIYGAADPSAPYGSAQDFSVAFIRGGIAGLLFDQRFGLLATAPVLLYAFVGLVMMLRQPWQRPDSTGSVPHGLAGRRLALELLFVIVPYLLTATSYAMWWAGWSAPARFAAPIVPLLAIPCAAAWSSIRQRATEVMASGALMMTAFVSGVLVLTDGGRLAYNTRDAYALWLDWASRLVDLGQGTPAWFRGQDVAFMRDVVVWAVALAAAWWATRALQSSTRLRPLGRFATAASAAYAAAGMCALTLVWMLHGVEGVRAAPAQLEFLRRLAVEPRTLVVELMPPRLVEKDQVLGRVRIEQEPRLTASGGAGRGDRPMLALPSIPAGRYRVRTRTRAAGGTLMLGIGQDQFALVTERLSSPPSPIEVAFPVDVGALIVRGDEEARRSVRSVVLEPQSIVPAARRLTDRVARRAVRYRETSVFFLDDRSFPEPEAFWVGGSRQSTIVLQPHRPATAVEFVMRNAPVENRISLESGAWREDMTLAPDEERRIRIPLTADTGAAVVTISSQSGFRPSEVVPDSRDDRFLGVWVRID
jgi:hypothetical protein